MLRRESRVLVHSSRDEPPQRGESVRSALHGHLVLVRAAVLLHGRARARGTSHDGDLPHGAQLGQAHAEPLHLALDDALLPPQGAGLALEAPVADAPGALGLARGDLLGRERGQGVGQAAEVGPELLPLAALEVLLLRGRGPVLGDAGNEGGVPDELLVALGRGEGVADAGLGPVDFPRGEGVG